MSYKSSTFLFFFALLNILLVPSISHAALVEAHAVYVEGVANYFSIEDSAIHPVEVDTPFREGDRVITGSDGKVEIEFETGALLLLDNDTDMTIRSLSKDDRGAVSAVFNLAVGLIKSSFSKLADNDSIEYQTKTAISGIAGTPEHIVKADVTEQGVDRTSVYLLGEEGDEGSLFVRGFDPDGTEVTLFAGQGTTVLAGLAPVIPFLFGPEILQSLGQMLFHTGGGAGTTAAGASASAGSTTAATTATTATAAGVSGTTMVIGGAAIAGVAAAAGSSSGGGGGSTTTTETTTPSDTTTPTGDTTTPTGEPTTPTGPTTPSEPVVEETFPKVYTGTFSHTFTATHECEDGSFDTVSCGGTCSATATLFADGSMTYSGFGNATDGCGYCNPECGADAFSGTHSNGTWTISLFGGLSANGTYDENSFTGSGGRSSSGGNEPTLTWDWNLTR